MTKCPVPKETAAEHGEFKGTRKSQNKSEFCDQCVVFVAQFFKPSGSFQYFEELLLEFCHILQRRLVSLRFTWYHALGAEYCR